MTNLNELANQIHENAKAKGFYDEPRNTGEQFMLIISELSEALEAHRSGKHANMVRFYGQLTSLKSGNENWWIECFKNYIKDTFEDEIADVVIRILDFCALKSIDLRPDNFLDLDDEIDIENAGERLISIVGSVYYASVSARAIETPHALNRDDEEQMRLEIYEALLKLFSLAKKEGFDLMRHIELKMKYNVTRERLHGKKY